MSFQRFDTRDVAPEYRFDYWRTWYSEAVDAPTRLEPVSGPRKDFWSSADVLRIGEVSIVELRCAASAASWRRADMEVKDLLRMVLFYRAPRLTGHWHGRRVRLLDGSPALVGRTGGGWIAHTGFRAIQVNVPRGRLPVSDATLDRVTDRPFRPDHPVFDTVLRPALLGMVGRLHELSYTATVELGTAWVSLVSLMVRSLSMDAAEPARLPAVQRYIEANLADPRLSPETIAAAFHMSRRGLYYLMSAEGEGIAARIRRSRLGRARDLLSDQDRRDWTIARIAADVGISGGAQFSRLFRAEYGETPREFRVRSMRS